MCSITGEILLLLSVADVAIVRTVVACFGAIMATLERAKPFVGIVVILGTGGIFSGAVVAFLAVVAVFLGAIIAFSAVVVAFLEAVAGFLGAVVSLLPSMVAM
jgi:hypothetical protein